MNDLMNFTQDYILVKVKHYNINSNYCEIIFIGKPDSVSIKQKGITNNTNAVITIHVRTNDASCNSIFSKDDLIALIKPLDYKHYMFDIIVFEFDYSSTHYDPLSNKYIRKIHAYNPITDYRLFEKIIAAYKRNYLDNTYFDKPLCMYKKLPLATVTHDGKNIDNNVAMKLNQMLAEDGKAIITKEITKMVNGIPVITRVIVNNPAVVVFWSDDTKTIGKCMDCDNFDPETGLAMAISRKYYELVGFANPRSAFKNQIKNAENKSDKTKEKKDRKQKQTIETNE